MEEGSEPLALTFNTTNSTGALLAIEGKQLSLLKMTLLSPYRYSFKTSAGLSDVGKA